MPALDLDVLRQLVDAVNAAHVAIQKTEPKLSNPKPTVTEGLIFLRDFALLQSTLIQAQSALILHILPLVVIPPKE